MALLDRGRHVVMVQRKKKGPLDRYNKPTVVDDGPPVAVRCMVQPLAADDAFSLGLEANTSYRVIARDWPGGIRSELTWNGRRFTPVGEPLFYSSSPRTQHYSVTMQAVAGEVL